MSDQSGSGGAAVSGLRVVVAEDEYMNKLLFDDLLQELESVVVAAVSTAEEVLPAAERNRPDVAILDVNLRGELIYGAASALHSRGIPIVFVTGYETLHDSPPELQDAPQVRKPFALRELESALRLALARSASLRN